MWRSYLLGGLRPAPLAIAAMLQAGSAMAALSDTIHPYVSIGYTYDDNLLRLPEGYTSIQGGSDRITQAQVGVLVERPFGRQKLTGAAKVSRVTFDRFDQLDYNGKDFNADLAWQLGNRFSGTLGGVYNETLTPFSDTVTDQRNLRKTRRGYATAIWQFHPSWQVRTGYTRNKYDYELLIQRRNDRTEEQVDVGMDYVASSGSRAGLVARRWKGSYENRTGFGSFFFPSDFTQRELKANINWAFSGITQVQILAGYAKREYDSALTRGSSGLNGRATVRWAPLGKVRFTAETWREFSAVESTIVSNSLNRGASLTAAWNATGKIQGTMSIRRENRDFEFLSDTAAANDAPDRTRSLQLGLIYTPTLATQVSLTTFSERRTGSALVGTTSYRAKGVALNASAQF